MTLLSLSNSRFVTFQVFALVAAFLLFPPAVYAATITVDQDCSINDAIESANSNQLVGGCTAGSGTDTIELTENVSMGFYCVSRTNGGASGAIYIDGAPFTLNASSFIDNRAGFRGGAIAIYSMKGHPGSNSSITNSTFHNNRSGIYGGAIHIVGGAYWTGPSDLWPNLTNPGAVNVDIKNSTFVNNRSTGYYNGSAINVSLSGLSSVGPFVRFYNSIVGSSGWPRACIGFTVKENILSTDNQYCSAGLPVASHLGLGAIVAPNNAPAYLPLLSDSPAIGAGNSTQCPSADIRGASRPQPAGSNCDLGAYEHPSDLAVAQQSEVEDPPTVQPRPRPRQHQQPTPTLQKRLSRRQVHQTSKRRQTMKASI